MATTFREFIENQDIDNILNSSSLVLFFTKDGDIFGAPEESRVVFARMKNPDDAKWQKEASFVALNLFKTLLGEPTKSVFGANDLKSLKVIDRDKAVHSIKIKLPKGKTVKADIAQTDEPDGPTLNDKK